MKNKRTYSAKKNEIARVWYLVDAKDQILGRMATKIAAVLWGKNKTTFTPHMDTGDNIVLINAKDIKVTGGKEKKKIYFTHSDYPHGAKTLLMEEVMRRDPRKVVRHAVRGMLPKGRLGNSLINKLHMFVDDKHPFADKELKAL